MDQQKQRLCFIMKLKLDELMIIFEMSSEENWKTALSIAAVCHRWRGVVHKTPKAWRTLRLPDFPPLNIILMYLAHSKPLLLHLSTPGFFRNDPGRNRRYSDIINQNSDRIKCLTTCPKYLDTLTGHFPHLRQIDLGDGHHLYADLGNLLHSRFPSLSQLKAPGLHCRLSSAIVNHPPIQVLTIGTDDKGTWLKILAILQKTLVTLRIEVYSDDEWQMPTRSFDFPLLKYLDIIPIQNSIPLIFDAKTPSLRSYVEYPTLDEPLDIEVDFAVITHLHLPYPVDLDLTLYPMVRHLRIQFKRDEIVEMIVKSRAMSALTEH